MNQDGSMITPQEWLEMWRQACWSVKRRSEADPGHEYMPMSPIIPLTLVKCEEVLDPENDTPDSRSIEIHNGHFQSTHVRPIGEFVNQFKYMIPTIRGPELQEERLIFQFDRCSDSFQVLQQYMEDAIAVNIHISRGMYGEPLLDLEGREVPPREPGWIAPRVLRTSIPKVQTKIVMYYKNQGDSNGYGEQITEESFDDIRYRLHSRAIPFAGRDLWVFWMVKNEKADSVVEVPEKVVSGTAMFCPPVTRPGSRRVEATRAAFTRERPFQVGNRRTEKTRSEAPTSGPARLSTSTCPEIPQEEEAAHREIPTNSGRRFLTSSFDPQREPSLRLTPSSTSSPNSAAANGSLYNERRSNAPGKRRAYC